jgi:uncharacterized protein YozE (UPF0346 family)
MITFRSWIFQCRREDSPFGDLARDILEDIDFPEGNDYDTILEYLESCHACPECIETFEEAYEAYLCDIDA